MSAHFLYYKRHSELTMDSKVGYENLALAEPHFLDLARFQACLWKTSPFHAEKPQTFVIGG